jgi:predicted permease
LENLALLAVCFLAAPLLRRLGRLPEGTPAALNAFVINVALPATVLVHVPAMRFDPAMVFAASMAWLVFAAAAAVVFGLRRVFGWDAATAGCLLLVAGLGNTSFLGLPMTEAFYGSHGAGVALVCDQAGSFLTLSTLGLLTAARFSGAEAKPAAIAQRIVLFPPFIALLVALALRPLSPFADVPMGVLQRLSATLPPLALFSVGAQLRIGALGDDLKPLLIGLGYKLVAAPALMFGIAAAIGAHGLVPRVTVLEAAMPPMITAGIIAAENGLRPRLANLLVGIGIIASFVTVPIVWLLTRAL